ncbi:hypothetical protein Prum_012250 [Phytohabitans rumicis]|uniref:S1 motif domain-containing protein n=1 Tax=Phytohabitans rumicis TaxID=1076125 RepID=A0A6V8KQY8_9ACTN|nr:hypothetical protein Prum_012250 [Phytohabitans rumicis]
MIDRLSRWAIVEGTVVDHVPYGLLVRIPSGETGVVDRALIADSPTERHDWPAIGESIAVVGAGYTSAGQLRLSARQSHLSEARTRSAEKEE